MLWSCKVFWSYRYVILLFELSDMVIIQVEEQFEETEAYFFAKNYLSGDSRLPFVMRSETSISLC